MADRSGRHNQRHGECRKESEDEAMMITDNMKLWGLALVAARKRNKEENVDLGLSDAVIDALSIQDASEQVQLD